MNGLISPDAQVEYEAGYQAWIDNESSGYISVSVSQEIARSKSRSMGTGGTNVSLNKKMPIRKELKKYF